MEPFDDRERRSECTTFGLSVPRRTAERIEALLGIKPEKRNRSEAYMRILNAGMTVLYGDDWAAKADVLRDAARLRARPDRLAGD